MLLKLAIESWKYAQLRNNAPDKSQVEVNIF